MRMIKLIKMFLSAFKFRFQNSIGECEIQLDSPTFTIVPGPLGAFMRQGRRKPREIGTQWIEFCTKVQLRD